MQRVLRSDQVIRIGVLRHLARDSGLEMACALGPLYPKLKCVGCQIDFGLFSVLCYHPTGTNIKIKNRFT